MIIPRTGSYSNALNRNVVLQLGWAYRQVHPDNQQATITLDRSISFTAVP